MEAAYFILGKLDYERQVTLNVLQLSTGVSFGQILYWPLTLTARCARFTLAENDPQTFG